MKKILSLALFGILALSGTIFSVRAANLAVKPRVSQKNELKKFDKFLDKHHSIETDLRASPNLINDAQYLSNHKDLEGFLRKNPKVTADLSNNPNYFMNRETHYQAKQNKSKKHHWWWHH